MTTCGGPGCRTTLRLSLLVALGTAALTSPAVADRASCPEDMAFVAGGTPKSDGAQVAPFCMDRTEITGSKYRACAASGACAAPGKVGAPGASAADLASLGSLCNDGSGDRANHPVNCVDWAQASAYCKAQGKRLPTSAEWAWAAQGRAQERTYPWGNDRPDETRLNACGSECVELTGKIGRPAQALFPGSDGFPSTAPVGSFPAGDSRDGIHDLSGNVAEWTATPSGDGGYIVRGGGWSEGDESRLRAGFAGGASASARLADTGFRCALDAGAASVPTLGGAGSKAEAAARACSARADLIFVRKCLQACMIESKTRTRVMQDSVERELCQLKCGRQPEMLYFLNSCMERAGYRDYRPSSPEGDRRLVTP